MVDVSSSPDISRLLHCLRFECLQLSGTKHLESKFLKMSETPSSENEDVNVGDSAMDSQDAQDDSENVPQVEEEQKEKLLRLPLSRVKYIAKYDPDVNLVNQEASFLLTKSTVKIFCLIFKL